MNKSLKRLRYSHDCPIGAGLNPHLWGKHTHHNHFNGLSFKHNHKLHPAVFLANNFNSFLKLKFFKNVLTEILKINSFSLVAKTKKFKAEDCSLIFTK